MELSSVETVVKALNDAGVEYFVVGGVAVNAHGFVRMTRDLDLVIRLERSNCLLALQTLFQIGYQMAIPVSAEQFADPEVRESWRNDKNMIVLKLWSDRHQRTPIDVFIHEPFDLAKERLQMMSLELAPGVSAPIVSLETLIEMKQAADRPQDQIDIQELQRIQ